MTEGLCGSFAKGRSSGYGCYAGVNDVESMECRRGGGATYGSL